MIGHEFNNCWPKTNACPGHEQPLRETHPSSTETQKKTSSIYWGKSFREINDIEKGDQLVKKIYFRVHINAWPTQLLMVFGYTNAFEYLKILLDISFYLLKNQLKIKQIIITGQGKNIVKT